MHDSQNPNVMDVLFDILLGIVKGDRSLRGKFYPHRRGDTLTVTAPNRKDDFRFQLKPRGGTLVDTLFLDGSPRQYNLKNPEDLENLEKSIIKTLHALLLYGPPKN